MDLLNHISVDRCTILRSPHKRGALREMVELMASTGAVSDATRFESLIFSREASMSTGIGLGIAVPHARIENLKSPAVAVGVSPSGISDYESLDDEPVRLVLMIATATGQPEAYSRLLSQAVSILKRESVREDLSLVSAPAQICSIIRATAEGIADGGEGPADPG